MEPELIEKKSVILKVQMELLLPISRHLYATADTTDTHKSWQNEEHDVNKKVFKSNWEAKSTLFPREN